MQPGIHERKWEIDSLCYPIRLAYHYWKKTSDKTPFDADWKKGIEATLKTFKEQQRKTTKGPYHFQRETAHPTDSLPMAGYGFPVNPVGLICSAFRPSDDATIFPFLIPSNFFAVTSLKQAAELMAVYHEKIRDCDKMIEQALSKFDSIVDKSAITPTKKRERSKNLNTPAFDLHGYLYKMTGVNLTAIPGINSHTAFKVISEIGLDLTKWATVKHFASWLGLCPGNKISGGKRLSGKTKPCANRAAAALRMAAVSLERSRTALGAFYRRQKTRLGAPKAITATAHKLACLIYNLLTRGTEYVEQGMSYYEEKYQERVIRGLRKKAHAFGLKLVQELEK